MTVQDTQTAQETPTGVILTDVAATKVKTLLEQEGRDDLALRIAVQPGGCSGLRYQLFFDERQLDGDTITDFGGVNVVVDRMSTPYLGGATIDFVDTIEKQGFTIDNPNASGSCACGDSFHCAAEPIGTLTWSAGHFHVRKRRLSYDGRRFCVFGSVAVIRARRADRPPTAGRCRVRRAACPGAGSGAAGEPPARFRTREAAASGSGGRTPASPRA